MEREWRFEGHGYTSAGDAHLAESLAEAARLTRRLARTSRP